jgi:teichuronic acid biosynthesis glycosyltransferase TuaC
MRLPRVLVLARNFPNNSFPTLGLWTERLVSASTAVARPTVIAPVPYAPPFMPSAYFRRFRAIARSRTAGDVTVHHTRVPAGPGQLLHAFDARLALPVLRRKALALHRAEPFDLIHAHFIYPDGVIASRIGEDLGIPVVSSEHAMWRPWLDRHPAVRRQVDRAIPAIARITAVSDALRREIVDIVGDGVPVDLLPNVVDERTFDVARPGEDRDAGQLLFVGLIRNVKGLDVLVRSLGHLLPDHPDLHLSVAGGAFFRGYERDAAEVRRLVTDLGLQDRVRFLGDVRPDEVARLMRTSALLVVPSRRESFSLVTAEALASGTPVVATRCGGPEEIVTPETGVMADVDDPMSLARAIGEALGRSFDAASLRRQAVERFGSQAAVSRLGLLYTRVLAGGASATAVDGIVHQTPGPTPRGAANRTGRAEPAAVQT